MTRMTDMIRNRRTPRPETDDKPREAPTPRNIDRLYRTRIWL